jgi:aspartate/methionine/tyrosine aminotransferase
MMRPFHSRRLPEHLDAELLEEPPLAPDVIDLTLSNPTRCGLPEALPLPQVPAHLTAAYAPEPMGPSAGRQSVAHWMSRWGRATEARQVMLTSSTSEAFSVIFKMACNPGDVIGVGLPGYPLVPHLAELEGLGTQTFAIAQQADGAWRLDLPSVERVLKQGAVALVLVSPGNPIGAYLTPRCLQALAELCNRHQALVIFDEVFAPYHHASPHARLTAVDAFERAICVGGLSKAALLPQAKVSWLCVHGAPSFQAAALAGLEWIGDAFLSLGVTALALPEILEGAQAVQAAVRARVGAAYDQLVRATGPSCAATVDAYSAGWYAVVRPVAEGPAVRAADAAGEHLAQRLLRQAGVHLQPGYLFDLPGAHTLVASLIVPEGQHARGWQRVLRHLVAPQAG